MHPHRRTAGGAGKAAGEFSLDGGEEEEERGRALASASRMEIATREVSCRHPPCGLDSRLHADRKVNAMF